MSELPLLGDSVASFGTRKGSPEYDFCTRPRVQTASLTDAQRALYDTYRRALTLTGISGYERGVSAYSPKWSCAYCNSAWSSTRDRCKSCGAPRR